MSKRSRRRIRARDTVSSAKPTPVSPDSDASPDDSVSKHIVQRLDDGLAPVLNDPAERGKVIEQIVSVIEQEEYRGPLPHPAHFAEFERASRGAGSKIIKMADDARKRADDRYDMVVTNDHQYRTHGLWLGAGVLVVCVIAGTVLCLHGQEFVGGGILVASALTTVASRFIDGKAQTPPKA